MSTTPTTPTTPETPELPTAGELSPEVRSNLRIEEAECLLNKSRSMLLDVKQRFLEASKQVHVAELTATDKLKLAKEAIEQLENAIA